MFFPRLLFVILEDSETTQKNRRDFFSLSMLVQRLMMFLFYDSFECKFMFTRNVLHIRKKEKKSRERERRKNLWLCAQILLNIIATYSRARASTFVIMEWTESEERMLWYHISPTDALPSWCRRKKRKDFHVVPLHVF